MDLACLGCKERGHKTLRASELPAIKLQAEPVDGAKLRWAKLGRAGLPNPQACL